MAKANVNTASREQLVEAGVRADLADEILKLRRKSKISSIEALDELPGVGPATLAQLRSLLDFSDRGGNGDHRGQEREQGGSGRERGTEDATKPMVGTSRGPIAAGATAARTGLQATQRAVDTMGREVTHRTAEGMAGLGQVLLDLLQEQARHNLTILTAFSEAVDWERCFRLQSEYLRASLDRMAGLNQRYLEAAQAVMTAAADVTHDRVDKAA